MGRALECLWILATLIWLGFAAGIFWGWPAVLSVFDAPPGSPLSHQALSQMRDAFVISFIVIPPAIFLVLGWLLEAAMKLFQNGCLAALHPNTWHRG